MAKNIKIHNFACIREMCDTKEQNFTIWTTTIQVVRYIAVVDSKSKCMVSALKNSRDVKMF